MSAYSNNLVVLFSHSSSTVQLHVLIIVILATNGIIAKEYIS